MRSLFHNYADEQDMVHEFDKDHVERFHVKEDTDLCCSDWTQAKHDYDNVVGTNRDDVDHDVRFHVYMCTWKCSNHVAGIGYKAEERYAAYRCKCKTGSSK